MAARLNLQERAKIEALVAEGVSVEKIACSLGRCPTTVHRELKRAGGKAGYNAQRAHQEACERALRPKQPKMAENPELAKEVRERLGLRWSPHAIAADLRIQDRPPALRVCAETIYRACYHPTGSSGLPEKSWQRLPRRYRRRKPRKRANVPKHNVLGDIRMIWERPPGADLRSEAGHWEGDLIMGSTTAQPS